MIRAGCGGVVMPGDNTTPTLPVRPVVTFSPFSVTDAERKVIELWRDLRAKGFHAIILLKVNADGTHSTYIAKPS